MILYVFIIIIIIALIIFLSFRNINSSISKNNFFKLKIIFFIFISSIATMLYITLSNYWIGTSLLEKVITQTNVENRKANEIAIVREAMNGLERELIKNPENLEN